MERGKQQSSIVLTIKGTMYTCKRLEHGENHNKSLEECRALDVQQPTIYGSRNTVKILLPNQIRPLLTTMYYRNLCLCNLM